MGRAACARQCKYFIGCQIYGYFQQRKMNGLCLHRPVYLAQTRFPYLNWLLDCRAKGRGRRSGVGGSEGLGPCRSCESNYVLGNVIICNE